MRHIKTTIHLLSILRRYKYRYQSNHATVSKNGVETWPRKDSERHSSNQPCAMTMNPPNSIITATAHPVRAISLAALYATKSDPRARHIPIAPIEHNEPIANFDATMKRAHIQIISGLGVACQLSTPPATVAMDVAARTAPSVPPQPITF
jgi:hypothetical protein